MPRFQLTAAALGVALVMAPGCNPVKFSVDSTADVLKVAAPANKQESDVELARAAAPGGLKTVEGFLLGSPNNRDLLAMAAEGYCSYTFGFIESDIEELTLTGKDAEAEALSRRATILYLRCLNYGLRLLGGSWDEVLYGDLASFEKAVKAAGRDKVAGLYWVALGLASAVGRNLDDIEMVAYLPKARLLLERVVQLDEAFGDAGAHMALGALYASTSPAIGGDPDRGRKHFERAIELTGDKHLMPKVLLARTYGTSKPDRDFFRTTLREVLATSPAIDAERRLSNELAQLRARLYLAHESYWF